MVRVLNAAEEIDPHDAAIDVDARNLLHNLFYLLHGAVGALYRGGIGKLKREQNVALVLFGKKTGRQSLATRLAKSAKCKRLNGMGLLFRFVRCKLRANKLSETREAGVYKDCRI